LVDLFQSINQWSALYCNSPTVVGNARICFDHLGQDLVVARRLPATSGAGEANRLGATGSRGQNHGRGGVKELGAGKFATTKNVETDFVGKFDLFQQMLGCARRG
jgi:hypothetical protein